jgi:hypothetical protein
MKKFLAISALVPVIAVAVMAAPVLASTHGQSGSSVSNTNSAVVSNTVTVTASTGSNVANTTASANGSGAANGSVGGYIVTGDAVAGAQVTTVANGNLSMGGKSGSVTNKNEAVVSNIVGVSADSGSNTANTAVTASGSNGGHGHDSGVAGNSGVGGTVSTGDALAGATVTNYLNASITKI